MSTVIKRKIRLKKKNFVISIICIFIIVLVVTKSINFVVKLVESPKKEIKQTTEKKDKNETEKEKDKEEKDLETIKNEIDYYNGFTNASKNLNIAQSSLIDLEPYKDIVKARNLNKPTILVNKYYYLEDDYVPDNLEKISTMYALSGMRLVDEAREAFEEMAKDASKQNLNIIAMSTYRSYNYQIGLYNRYVKADGEEKADTYSGRPGHSEHQTGLAVDVYNKKENYTNFGNTKEFDWMKKHAHEYGFILRFPKDKENETGYTYESWHYRYVGKNAAKYIKENNISFEEYYATIIKDW